MPGLIIKVSGLQLGQNSHIFPTCYDVYVIRNLCSAVSPSAALCLSEFHLAAQGWEGKPFMDLPGPFTTVTSTLPTCSTNSNQGKGPQTSNSAQGEFPFLLSGIQHWTLPRAKSQGEQITCFFMPQGPQLYTDYRPVPKNICFAQLDLVYSCLGKKVSLMPASLTRLQHKVRPPVFSSISIHFYMQLNDLPNVQI